MENWYKYEMLTLDLGDPENHAAFQQGEDGGGPGGTFEFPGCAHSYSGHRNFYTSPNMNSEAVFQSLVWYISGRNS